MEDEMRDPRDCHGGECADCGGWFRDEDDLNDAMLCEGCERDAEAEEEAEAEYRRHEAAAERLALPDDWFAVAADITGVAR
jgi:hypothetical protein